MSACVLSSMQISELLSCRLVRVPAHFSERSLCNRPSSAKWTNSVRGLFVVMQGDGAGGQPQISHKPQGGQEGWVLESLLHAPGGIQGHGTGIGV